MTRSSSDTYDSHAAMISPSPPLVSIGMPVFNEARHLRAAIDSILALEYPHFEVVIVDNASDDETPLICREYAGRDPRIRYHRSDVNIGGIANFNKVFELARGQYFSWAAGHDLRLPSQLSGCVKVLEEDPAVVLAYTRGMWMDTAGATLGPLPERIDTRGLETRRASRLWRVLWGLAAGGCLLAGVARSAALRQTQMYRATVGPDVNLLVELSLIGTFACVDEPLFLMRHTIDSGDWRAYVAKHLGPRWAGSRGAGLYWGMIHDAAARVAPHFTQLLPKVMAVAVVGASTAVRYRWVLSGLLDSAQRRDAA